MVFVYLFMQRVYCRAVEISSLSDLEVLPDISTQPSWPDVKHALDNWAAVCTEVVDTISR